MKLLETILSSSIVGLIIAIGSYIIAKRTIKTEKEALFEEIPDKIIGYLSTPEGQQSVRNLGTLFSQGISKGIGLGDSPLKGKTFGIPNVVLMRILDQYMPKKTKEAISKEPQSDSSESFG